MSGPCPCPSCGRVFQWGEDADSAIVACRGAEWESCRKNAAWKLNFHMRAEHPDALMKCPRRDESPMSAYADGDYWHVRDHHRVCSYCGSMHPDELFAAIEAGRELGPTDKSYKVYVDLAHPTPDAPKIVSAINFEPDAGDVHYAKWTKVTDDNRALLLQHGWGVDEEEARRYTWFLMSVAGPTIHAKFYFPHLDRPQMLRFIDLYNSKRMKLGMPGHFYRMPFFMRASPPAAAS